MRKILRSIYLDQSLDEALALRAEAEQTTKAELMRTYIAAGLERPSQLLVDKPAASAASVGDNMVRMVPTFTTHARDALPVRKLAPASGAYRQVSGQDAQKVPRRGRGRSASSGR